MNFRKLLFRSLAYYRRSHRWIVLGTMISTSIIVGAFVIGDSVRFSLRQIVFDRLGQTEFALSSGDRFFRTELADDLKKVLHTNVAPLLQTRGIAVADGGARRINHLQVLGVDSRFGQLGASQEIYDSLMPDEAVINRYLAARLGVKAGDEILLRAEKLDSMPKDAPLALDTDSSLARRFKVKTVVSDAEFGRFNLREDQASPLTVFVSLSFLSQEMDLANRANVLLVAERENNPLDLLSINEAFRKEWSLDDAGLEIRRILDRDITELRSNRIFLDSSTTEASLILFPEAEPVLTYFVNEIRLGNNATPYSFVSAPGDPQIQTELKEDDIIINDWLASDISASVGDPVQLTYFILGPRRDLEEMTSTFKVKSIVPLQGIYVDKDLLPNFPGLAGEDNCRDWNPGIPIDLDKIRDKDEDYWDNYGGTPKAFVSLETAQKMWTNRFGNVTAVRFPGVEKDIVENKLREAIDPGSLGFKFWSVKEEGLRASSQSVSFSQLFLGLSFFIVLAALLLTGLLFVFNTEKRSEENGLYLAVGISKKIVRKLVLFEGVVLITVGSLFGGFVGVIYNQVVLWALKTVWQSAVGTSALRIHLNVFSIFSGIAIGSVVAFITIWLVMRKQIGQSVTSLQRGQTKLENLGKKRPKKSQIFGIVCMAAVIFLLLFTNIKTGDQAFAVFFIAGFLLLAGGMFLTNAFLFKIGQSSRPTRLSLLNLGIRNNSRKRLRSVTLIGLLACGLFIVFTVGANRLNSLKDADRRDSGTGGFALYGESSLPVLYDLNSPKGRQFYGLERVDSKDIRYVQFRVREGDDASCLNLNQVTNPPLIGVEPSQLIERGSFTFAEKTDDVDPGNPWSVLDKKLPGEYIPAIADLSVIVWGLGKSVGDFLDYEDEEGNTFKLKLVGGLANSIFQGNIIVSEEVFIQKYPSISGYRIFLADISPENRVSAADDLAWTMQDLGLDIVSTSKRLAEFNAVQNTYLSIFLILGSFGLLLGSFGLGIVVWRNIMERRGELALLRAVGFSRKSVQAIVLFEHFTLLAAGIFYGMFAALLASLPSLLTPGAKIPYPTILIIFVAIGLNGGIWTYVAAKMATKEDLSPALRKE
ncbi:FtsX-like permease family protein [Acidobacteriota bacterium]